MTPRPARLAVATAVVATFLSLTPRASADYILDGFTNPNPGQMYQISLLNGNPYNSPSVATGVTGVTRDVQVTVNSPIPTNFNSVSGTIGGSTFTMDTDNATAATSAIKYTLTGTAQDLSKATAIDLAFKNIDGGNSFTTTPVTVTIVTSSGTKTLSTTVADSTTAFTKSFALSSFSGTGNMAQVSSITFTFNGGAAQTAVDFALDDVRVKTVPVPPTALLAGFGVLALVGRARLARKPAAA